MLLNRGHDFTKTRGKEKISHDNEFLICSQNIFHKSHLWFCILKLFLVWLLPHENQQFRIFDVTCNALSCSMFEYAHAQQDLEANRVTNLADIFIDLKLGLFLTHTGLEWHDGLSF